MTACIYVESTVQQRQLFAQTLSERLQLLISTALTDELNLVITDDRVELQSNNFGKPIFIDFVEGKNAHRRKFGGGRGQPFAKAIGLKKGATPTVIDATAGFGRDSFVLATLGCEITLIERQGILWALLSDALERAQQDSDVSDIANRMALVHASSYDYLTTLSEDKWPDVIYMDPMYPSRDKSALVKKDMQLLHQLVGPDTDSNDLLTIARQRAKKRVVIKRPKSAPFVGEQKPSVSIDGKTTRYDIYLS